MKVWAVESRRGQHFGTGSTAARTLHVSVQEGAATSDLGLAPSAHRAPPTQVTRVSGAAFARRPLQC